MTAGQLPPHDPNAEAAVLGALLIDPRPMDEVREVLQPEHFYSEAHRRIFEAFVAVHAETRGLDVVHVLTRLRETGRYDQVGGAAYVSSLQANVPAGLNAPSYARVVRKHHTLRQVLDLGHRLVAQCYAGVADVPGFVDEVQQTLARLADQRQTETLQPIKVALHAAITAVKRAGAEPGGIAGTPTGLRELDEALGGLRPGELYVFAGRPAMGKSALAFQALAWAGLTGRGGVGFSLEMPAEQVALRLACAEARVAINRARRGAISPSEWAPFQTAAVKIAGYPLWLDDRAGLTLQEIRSRTRRVESALARDAKTIGLVVVDYVQLCESATRRDSREQAVAEVSRGLKQLAKDFRTPVIALSQLNRDVEKRTDKRPGLADLRESGSLEQDADAVVLLYRDEYYHPDTRAKGIAEIIVAKQRNGATGTRYAGFDGATTTFRDLRDGELSAAGLE